MLGFLDHTRVVPDHRIPGMVTYPLDEILLATLAGVVCGADDWEGVEEIATGGLNRLRGFRPFANGIPTAQTLRKVFPSDANASEPASTQPSAPASSPLDDLGFCPASSRHCNVAASLDLLPLRIRGAQWA